MRVKYLAMVGLIWGCQRPAAPAAPPPPGSPVKAEAPASEPSAEAPAPGETPAGPPGPGTYRSEQDGIRLSLPLDKEGPEPTWVAVSADGSASVIQRPLKRGKKTSCRVTATAVVEAQPRRVMWEWENCLATREQLVFVSPDGQRVLVVDPTAVPVGGKPQSLARVTLYEHGLRMKVLWAESATGGVKGTAGLPGTPPRYSGDGAALEFETGEGRGFRLGFDGTGFPPTEEEAHAFLASEDLYRYTDEEGAERVVQSVDEIPERFRSRARTVKARVFVEPASASRAAEPLAQELAKELAARDAGSGVPAAGPVPPSELVDKARKTVEDVQEIQREQKRVLDSLH